MRFGFRFDALTFQGLLFGWRTIADHVSASSAHVFSSHEKAAEMPPSSSSVLGASRNIVQRDHTVNLARN
jgi:hypothetical protein